MQQWLRRDLVDYLRRELVRAPAVVADPPAEKELTSHLAVLPHDVCLASHNGDIDRVQAFLERCVRAASPAAPTIREGCPSRGLSRLA